jgi:hypothetical protein
MSLNRIFISGPMDAAFQQFQLHEEQFRQEVTHSGLFNPYELTYTNPIFTPFPANGFREGISELVTSDTVVFLPGWELARGCLVELMVAATAGCALYELQYGERLTLSTLNINRENLNEVMIALLENQQKAFVQAS